MPTACCCCVTAAAAAVLPLQLLLLLQCHKIEFRACIVYNRKESRFYSPVKESRPPPADELAKRISDSRLESTARGCATARDMRKIAVACCQALQLLCCGSSWPQLLFMVLVVHGTRMPQKLNFKHVQVTISTFKYIQYLHRNTAVYVSVLQQAL